MAELNLRYFYESAKLGSMRAAADSLGIAVSSISRQIAQLEAELGVPLIEHGRRSIKLTEAGKLMLEYYNEQVAQREVFEQRLSDLKGLRSGRINLAIGEGFISQALSSVLSRFLNAHSGILMEVRVVDSSNEVARLVENDEAHLGLSFNAASEPRLRARASIPQPLRAIVRPGHPLAGRASIRLADLTGHRTCLLESSFRTRQLLKLAEESERVTLTPCFTSNSIGLLKEMVISDELVSLMPVLAVVNELTNGDLIAIPVTNTILQGTVVNLLSRVDRQLPPAPARLLTVLEAHLNNNTRLGAQLQWEAAE
jgi:DNA-binding transcriptional LysR family regulator